jgi:hypothetical protein
MPDLAQVLNRFAEIEDPTLAWEVRSSEPDNAIRVIAVTNRSYDKPSTAFKLARNLVRLILQSEELDGDAMLEAMLGSQLDSANETWRGSIDATFISG